MPLFLKALDPIIDIFGNRQLFNFNKEPNSGESDSAFTLINHFVPIANVNANSTFEFFTPTLKGFRFNHSLSTTGIFGNFNFEKYDRFGLATSLWGYDEVTDSLLLNKESSFISNTANNQINLASISPDTDGNLKINIAKKIPNTNTYKGFQLSYEYSDNIGDSFSLFKDNNSILDRLFAYSETLNVFLFYRSISMNSNRITNLSDGIVSTDAVNKLQMESADTATLNAAKNYTDTTAYIVGEYRFIAGNVTPAKFLLCDGSSVSRTTYAALFAVIGTAFGSSSGTTFNLPDLRGKVLAAVDSTNTLGNGAGVNSQVLTTAQLPTHTHTATATAVAAYSNASGNARYIPGASMTNGWLGGYVGAETSGTLIGATTRNGASSYGTFDGTSTHTHSIGVLSSGSSASVDMRQPTCYGGNYYIYAGI